MIKTLKRFAMCGLTGIFFAAFSASAFVHAVTVNFTATDGQTYGNAMSWYPHDIVTKFVNMPGNTVNITYTLNGKVLNSDYTTPNYGTGGFTYDATTLDNGAYKLTAVLNTPTEHITAVTYGGNSYLSFTVNNATKPSAYFATADNGAYGTGTGVAALKLLTGFLQMSDGVVDIQYKVDGATIASNTKVNGGNSPGIELDVSKFSNGQHKLVAVLKNAAGVEANARTYTGNDYLSFSVNNSTTTNNDPGTGDPTPTSCTAKQKDFDAITTRILARTEAQLQVIQSVAANLDTYQSGVTKKLDGYDEAVAILKEDEKSAQNALIDVVSSRVITCNSDGTPNTTKFKTDIGTLLDAIAKYKTDTISLIDKLEKN